MNIKTEMLSETQKKLALKGLQDRIDKIASRYNREKIYKYPSRYLT